MNTQYMNHTNTTTQNTNFNMFNIFTSKITEMKNFWTNSNAHMFPNMANITQKLTQNNDQCDRLGKDFNMQSMVMHMH